MNEIKVGDIVKITKGHGEYDAIKYSDQFIKVLQTNTSILKTSNHDYIKEFCLLNDQSETNISEGGIWLISVEKVELKEIKAKYIWYINYYKGYSYLVIIDQMDNFTHMSVTNCIEDIILNLYLNKGIIGYLPVIYKDSNNTWDSYNIKTQQFKVLNANTEQEAIELYQKEFMSKVLKSSK